MLTSFTKDQSILLLRKIYGLIFFTSVASVFTLTSYWFVITSWMFLLLICFKLAQLEDFLELHKED